MQTYRESYNEKSQLFFLRGTFLTISILVLFIVNSITPSYVFKLLLIDL